MLKKGSKLYSILTGSCPRCQEESMYVDKNPYHMSKLYKMHDDCGHCKLHYNIEPSFFFGAMYVSYGLTVAISIFVFVLAKVAIGLDLFNSFMAIIVALVVLTPITARLARNIYINMFVHFNPDAVKNARNG